MQKKFKVNNVFYGVIGIATFMIAIIGATFAYFTATANNTTTITGNMATTDVSVTVTKVSDVDDEIGLVPMSNNMIEVALTKNNLCVDDNGNAVCQVYKIVVNNESSSSMFVDGYVTLSGGSGVPLDYKIDDTSTEGTNEREWQYIAAGSETTMRWVQAFCSTETNGIVSGCTTQGTSTVRGLTTVNINQLGVSDTAKADGTNRAEILTERSGDNGVTGTVAINKSDDTYEIINKNYIRVSDHTLDSYKYDRAKDTTSALVYNQYLDENIAKAAAESGTSSKTYTYSQVYYIAVWLSENGKDQTAGSGQTNVPTKTDDFFKGNVTFITAQGNEVTATFGGHLRVTPNTPIQ